MDYLSLACKKLNVSPEQVLNPRQEAESFILLVDRGIDGVTKHTIPLSELDPVEAEAKKVDELKAKLVQGQPANQAEVEAKKVDALKAGLVKPKPKRGRK